MNVVLEPRKAKQYSFGMGFGTDTGVRASMGMDVRYASSAGHAFKGWAQGSQIQNELELHYLVPGRHMPINMYDFNLTAGTLEFKDNKSTVGQIGVGYISVLRGWRQTVKLGLQRERYKLLDNPYESVTMLIPNINWLHSKSNDPVKPTRGHRISINAQGASRFILSTNNFFQAEIDAKYMRPISERMYVVLHAILGYTAINEMDNLPLSLQFYTGGSQTIRGFDYNAIGPGRNLGVGSVELRHQIVGDWYLAAFFDAGNASDDLFAKPNQGLGAGVLWRTGIGVFELTYAKAISEPGAPGRVQFSMGAEL
jgi:translocation and assembly module TamA